jgi:hypothetical protein
MSTLGIGHIEFSGEDPAAAVPWGRDFAAADRRLGAAALGEEQGSRGSAASRV